MSGPRIQGYTDFETLGDDRGHGLYRCVDTATRQSYLLKTPLSSRPSAQERSAIEKEFEVNRRLSAQIPNIHKALKLAEYSESLYILFEDVAGLTLLKSFRSTTPSLKTFFPLALKIVDTVAQIHRHRLIHKDLKPSHILWNRELDILKVGGFAISSSLESERSEVQELPYLSSALEYIAPEQSGRMNRAVDYRSDYYSLGIIFYEMLAGRVPFTAKNPMELVHSHLAKEPVPLKVLQADQPSLPGGVSERVPPALSDLVSKLLAKAQEDRYQSAQGLQADLERCRRQYEGTGSSDEFVLGSDDRSVQLTVPQKLYGRDADFHKLLSIIEDKGKKDISLVLVSGAAGVGKSSFVNELNKQVFERRGYLISGKYEQYQSHIPYSGFQRAFADYTQQLLKEAPELIERWRRRVGERLGDNVNLMSQLFPALKKLLGDHPPPAPLNPAEEQNRFLLAMGQFVGEIAREHPLVIFLDDLQWADAASLAVLESLLANKGIHGVLIIGAYRSNEVTSAHPLRLSLAAIEKSGPRMHDLPLLPFDQQTAHQFIADMLVSSLEDTASLAQLIVKKTEGNQFFTTELVKDLVRKGMVKFDHGERRWTWDIAAIAEVEVAADIAQLMVERLQKLSEGTRSLCMLAACIGSKFDMGTLSLASENPPQFIAEAIWEAVEAGLVIPLSNGYRLVDKLVKADKEALHKLHLLYQFQHDRVRSAAYSLLGEEERRRVHLKIGEALLSRLSEAEQKDRIIEIVRHLNQGLSLVQDRERRLNYSRYNYQASVRASGSHAFGPALEYAKVAKELLPGDSWDKDHAHSFAVTQQFSLCAFLNGEVASAEAAAAVLLIQARSPLAKADVYRMQALNYNYLWAIDKSIAAGIAGLRLLQIKVAPKPSVLMIVVQLLIIKWQLRKKTLSELEAQGEITDPAIKMAMQLLIQFVPPAYMSGNSNLFAVAVLLKTRLAIRYGHSEETAAAYSGYAALLSGLGDHKGARDFGEMAVRLCDRQRSLAWKSMTLNLYALFSLSWSKPWTELHHWFKLALDKGMESGDLLYTAFAAGFLNLWHPRKALPKWTEEQAELLTLIKATKIDPAIMSSQIHYGRALNFQGLAASPQSLSSKEFEEAAFLQRLKEVSFISGIAQFHMAKVQVSFNHGDIEKAYEHLKLADRHMQSLAGSPYVVEHSLYAFLTQAARLKTIRGWRRFRPWLRLRWEHSKMKKWSRLCPENFSHHLYLMEAEIAAVSGRHGDAIAAYSHAVKVAKEHNFIRYKALSCELAGNYYASRRDLGAAAHYLAQAYYFYETWGAASKLQYLRERYPEVLTVETRVGGLSTGANARPGAGILGTEVLDLDTVTKASSAISKEINVEQLLKKILSLVVENTGAQIGLLYLKKAEEWTLVARGGVDGFVLLSAAADSTTKSLPSSIFHYVVQTNECVILNDAADSSEYLHDPYIREHKVRSVFCAPIIHQNQTVGLWYLENSLTSGAFTAARVELVKILSSQFAISNENAELYSNLELKVEERTRELSEALQTLKETQEQLVESEKMASLGGLVTGMAHELNTPIGIALTASSSIRAQTEDFTKRINEGLKKSELVTYLDDMRQGSTILETSCQRAGSLITVFKQIAVSDPRDKPQLVNMKECLESALAGLKARLEERQMAVTITCHHELTLESYASSLSQVFSQLLSNTMDHGYAPGQDGEWLLAVDASQDAVRITAQDHGRGIAADHLGKIFEPFFTTDRYGGHPGLGLHLVYNIVTQKLRGQISCESEEGKFTRFTLVLPRRLGGELSLNSVA